MLANWFMRLLLCFVLIVQIPGSSAEFLVSVAEGEWLFALVRLVAVVGDIFFSYKIIRDGFDW